MSIQVVTKEDLAYAAQKQKEEFVAKEAGKGLSQNDLTNTLKTNYDAAKTHAESAHAPSGAQANVIETIKRNGTALTPASKTIDITVPTKIGELTNDIGFQTAAQVQTAIDTAVTGLYKVMGSCAFASLPTTGMKAGHTYNITNAFTTNDKFVEGTGKSYPAGTNVAYTADGKWDCLAGTYDLSVYIQASDLVEITKAEIDAMYA